MQYYIRVGRDICGCGIVPIRQAINQLVYWPTDGIFVYVMDDYGNLAQL